MTGSRLRFAALPLCVGILACSSSPSPGPSSGNQDGGGSGADGGGAPTDPTGGTDPDPNLDVWHGGGQTVCSRTVPESVLPSNDCTSPKVGPSYDGCSHANQPCGSVTGCPIERNEGIEGTVETTYTPGPSDYVAPTTLLPKAGTPIDGYASGWFARGDGTAATGSCGFPPVRNIMVTAISAKQFGNADWCGACAEVVGRSGRRIRIEIIDQCAGCPEGWIDMGAGKDSPYSMLDDPTSGAFCADKNGEQPVEWKIVPCETEGGVVVHYTAGFNHFTPSVQIRNHRLSLAKLEDQVDGVWADVPRRANNQYHLHSAKSSKAQPITLRITAIDGATITGTFPPFEPERDYETTSQF